MVASSNGWKQLGGGKGKCNSKEFNRDLTFENIFTSLNRGGKAAATYSVVEREIKKNTHNIQL